MARQQFATWLMCRADCSGRWAPLVGDFLEEIACGRRSGFWVWRQVIGFCGVVLLAAAKDQMRVTPHLVAAGLVIVLLGGASVTSIGYAVATWIVVYLTAGTMSLFGHIMSRTTGTGSRLTSGDST